MPRFFISYRRADSKTVTGRIYDRLRQEFGRGDVFKDVDDIPPGKDFRSVLKEAVAKCDVMFVIIGKQWLNITDDKNQRRLDDPDDFVRIEVEMGLQRGNMQVIPVLVEGASHPGESSLPDSLKPLAFLNSVVVRDDPDFHRDMNHLIHHLRRTTGVQAKKWTVAMVALLIVAGIAAGVVLWTSNLAPSLIARLSGSVASSTTPPRPPGETLFSETFDTNSRDWDLTPYDYGRARISQRRILLTSNPNSFIAEPLPALRRQDFYIEATVTPLAVTNIRVGFGVGSNEGNQVHLFLMGEDDGWEVRYFDFDGQRGNPEERLTSVIDSSHDPLWTSDDSIRVGLQARDGSYTLYFDGTALETIQANSYGDEIFLIVQSPIDTVEAYFDDVVVWGIETEGE